jgi:hypothetical protein
MAAIDTHRGVVTHLGHRGGKDQHRAAPIFQPGRNFS